MQKLTSDLKEQMAGSTKLDREIKKQLLKIGYKI